MAIDIILKLAGVDTGAIPMLNRVTAAGKAVEAQMSKLGVSPGLDRLEQRAKRFSDAMDVAKQKTENLSNILGKAQTWGAGIAVAGGAAMLLSKHLADVYMEGARADAKLQAMLTRRGEGNAFEDMAKWAGELAHNAALVDDDPIKEAAAGLLGFGMNAEQIQQIMPGLIGQSRLYGQSLDSVSMAFGKAFASGNAGALKRSGVTLSQADLDYIKAATSEVEKQQRMFERVKASMDNYALSITEGMSDAEIAHNRFLLELDNTQTALGKGAASAQKNMENLGARVLMLVGANPQLAEGAGLIFGYGAAAVTAGGSFISFIATIAQVYLGFVQLGIARAANAAAAGAHTAATVTEAAALTGTATAAGAATITLGTLLAIVGLLVVAIAGFAVAFIGAGDAGSMSADRLINKWGALGRLWVYLGDQFSYFWRKVTGAEGRDNALDQEGYAEYVATQKKYKRPIKTFEEWRGEANEDEYKASTPEEKPPTPPSMPAPSAPAMPTITATAATATSNPAPMGTGWNPQSKGGDINNPIQGTVVTSPNEPPVPAGAADGAHWETADPAGSPNRRWFYDSGFDTAASKKTDAYKKLMGEGRAAGKESESRTKQESTGGKDIAVDLNIKGRADIDAAGYVIIRLNANPIRLPLSSFDRDMVAYE